MTQEQFEKIMAILIKLTDRQYAITAASDWPILVVVGGLLIAAIGIMWVDLRSTIKDGREEWREELKEAKSDNEKGHDLIWDAMRDCQKDCCPRKKMRSDHE